MTAARTAFISGMSNDSRVPAGVPTGGQFAASQRAESDLQLAPIEPDGGVSAEVQVLAISTKGGVSTDVYPSAEAARSALVDYVRNNWEPWQGPLPDMSTEEGRDEAISIYFEGDEHAYSLTSHQITGLTPTAEPEPKPELTSNFKSELAAAIAPDGWEVGLFTRTSNALTVSVHRQRKAENYSEHLTIDADERDGSIKIYDDGLAFDAPPVATASYSPAQSSPLAVVAALIKSRDEAAEQADDEADGEGAAPAAATPSPVVPGSSGNPMAFFARQARENWHGGA